MNSFWGEQGTSEGSKGGQWYMCVEHFQLSSVPLRWKSLVPGSFSSLDSDIHTLPATRSNPQYPALPQSSIIVHCTISTLPVHALASVPCSWEAGGPFRLEHTVPISSDLQQADCYLYCSRNCAIYLCWNWLCSVASLGETSIHYSNWFL